jgi:predicted phosphodiesterase
MTATLLFVGDMHLGRRPARLPKDLAVHGVDPAALGPPAAWRRVQDAALRERVHAVVLAGDVVESRNARFEAFGHLQSGVRRLLDAGIAVFAVAGNHDVDVLPRLADQIDGFRLLGRDGAFELAPVGAAGRTAARLLGWSFPAPRVTKSPFALTAPPPLPADGIPVLGVLHGDLDASRSAYAPVARRELEAAGAAAWFLGHVHAPSLDARASVPIGYLGSLVGLEPIETGRHGPWRVTAGTAGVTLEHLPLAPLRWEDVAIDAGAAQSGDDLLAVAVAALRDLHARLAPELDDVLAVGCRIRVAGRVEDPGAVRAALASSALLELRQTLGGALFFVADVADACLASHDLHRLARGADPPGLLARALLALEAGGAECDALVRDARPKLERAAADAAWNWLDAAPLDDASVRDALLEAGRRTLEELLA